VIDWGKTRTSEADGRNSNETDIRKDDFGISKIMKISLQKFNDIDQIIRINRKKFKGCGITPSYFPALMKRVIFGHFSQYRVS
jgi:hypothetical protein